MAANTDLTGDSISATYTQLLHIGDDSGVEATEHYVVDGNGTASALSLGTTAVGIGTDSPTQLLDIDGNVSLNANYSASDWWGSGENSAAFFPYGYLGSSGAYAVSLYSNGYRNSSAGFTYLDINSNTNTASGIDLQPDGQILMRTGTASGTALPERLRIDSSGNVNISGLTASSDVQTDGSKNLVSTSDSRLKNDLGEITDGLNVIQNLTPRYFSWKDDENNNKQLGFFAQEVFEHLPESAPREEKMNLVSPEIQAQELIEWKEGELPTDEDTKDEIKAFMDGYGFEYNSGDTKSDLLDKIPSVKQEAVEAQEAVFERALDDEGNPDWNWGFNGRPIIAMLVKAVQELSAKVEALENE